MQNIKILTAGDASILVEFGKEINPEINRKIAATVQLMREQHIEGVVDVIPSFCALLINYDPRVIGYEEIKGRIRDLLKVEIKAGAERKKIFEIPVCYGGEFGPDMPAVGFGLGMERLLLIMSQLGVEVPKPVRYDVMLIGLGTEAKDRCFTLARALRKLGVSVDLDLMDRSVKAQMKYADKTGALYTLVIGDEEIKNDAANMKSMTNGESVMVRLDADEIANSIQRG